MDQQTARQTYQEASTLFAAGRYTEALVLLNKLHVAFPDNLQVAQAREKCQVAIRRAGKQIKQAPVPGKRKKTIAVLLVVAGLVVAIVAMVSFVLPEKVEGPSKTEGNAEIVAECSLLVENFDDGLAQNWETNQGDDWQIVDSEYRQLNTEPNYDRISVYAGPDAYQWTNYKADVDFRYISGSNRTDRIRVYFRYQDPRNYYLVEFVNNFHKPFGYPLGKIYITKWVDGQVYPLREKTLELNTDEINHLSITARENSFSLTLNEEPLSSFSDTAHPNGTIGLSSWYIAAGFDNICVSTLGEGSAKTEAPGADTVSLVTAEEQVEQSIIDEFSLPDMSPECEKVYLFHFEKPGRFAAYLDHTAKASKDVYILFTGHEQLKWTRKEVESDGQPLEIEITLTEEDIENAHPYGWDFRVVNRSGQPMFCGLEIIYGTGSVTLSRSVKVNPEKLIGQMGKGLCDLIMQSDDESVKRDVIPLAKNSAILEFQDDLGKTPLHYAIEHEKVETVSLLINKGADWTIQDHSGMSPLVLAKNMASESGILDALLTSALLTEAKQGSDEKVQQLLDAGADPNPVNEAQGFTAPLAAAAGAGHLETVRLLVEHGANPNESYYHAEDGARLPIHQAVWGSGPSSWEKYISVIEELLKHDVDINVAMKGSGETSLTIAAMHGEPEILEFLLKRGADVSAQGLNGYTALHRACSRFYALPERQKEETHLNIVKMLLEAGADPAIVDNQGNTPLILANNAGLLNVAALLTGRVSASHLSKKPSDDGKKPQAVPAVSNEAIGLEEDTERAQRLLSCYGVAVPAPGRWLLWGGEPEEDAKSLNRRNEYLYLSNDGGATWRQASSPVGQQERWVYSVAALSSNPDCILVGGGSRDLRLTRNGGRTWSKMLDWHAPLPEGGTEQIMHFFWSNDDESIAYISLQKNIFKINVNTGDTSAWAKIEEPVLDHAYADGQLYLKLFASPDEGQKRFRYIVEQPDGTLEDISAESSPWLYELRMWSQINDLMGIKSSGGLYMYWNIEVPDTTWMFAGILPMKAAKSPTNTGLLFSMDSGNTWNRMEWGKMVSGLAAFFDRPPFVHDPEEQNFSYISRCVVDSSVKQILVISDGVCYASGYNEAGATSPWRVVVPVSEPQ